MQIDAALASVPITNSHYPQLPYKYRSFVNINIFPFCKFFPITPLGQVGENCPHFTKEEIG